MNVVLYYYYYHYYYYYYYNYYKHLHHNYYYYYFTIGVSMVIHALKALYANEELQIEGLKMLQMLSRTDEGML